MESICDSIVKKAAEKLLENKAIDASELDAYHFGLEVTILKGLHFLSYFIIACIMKSVVEFIIIYMVFYIFRRNAGGFHAKTRVGCYLFSCISIVISLWMAAIKIDLWMICLLTILDIILLLIIGPVQSENKKLDEEETGYYRRRLLLIAVIYFFIYSIALFLGNEKIIWLFTIGLSMITIWVVLGKMSTKEIDPSNNTAS